MLHNILIYTWTILLTILLAPLAVAVGLVSKNGNVAHWIARCWGRSILWISRVPVTVNGLANIPSGNASFVFMANHLSNFDIPILLARLPVQFRWLAKRELFDIPLFGRAMRGCGYISIDRGNLHSAIRSLHRAAEIVRNGTAVMIFPEGTRSPDGKIHPFKKGGFVLTVDAGVPIVPLILHGTWHIMPKGRKMVRPRPVTLDVLQPVDTSEYDRRSKEALMDRIKTIMCEHFAQYEGYSACS
ncbi:MAG TPA: lysophospholipid acyltransferase family protein [Desulfobacterales bacterium]